jgi:aryl-alcohol dehydrogenase-like predicted oxidoreductase
MRYRCLGTSELVVSAIGLGCTGMNECGAGDEADCLATIGRAADLGINFLDSNGVCGWGVSDEFVGRALRHRREEFVVAAGFGLGRAGGSVAGRTGHDDGIEDLTGRVRATCDASLRRLGLDVIDLYYPARVDPLVPIEDTVGAMAELVWHGKVRYLGLGEASANTLRRADRIYPIMAVTSEYSLCCRGPEEGTVGMCRDLGATLIARGPLGRGLLTGTPTADIRFASDGVQRGLPRVSGEKHGGDVDLVPVIAQLAAEKSCTVAQLALAWVLAQGCDVIPIPGTRRRRHLEENAAAFDVELTADDLARLSAIAPPGGSRPEIGQGTPWETLGVVTGVEP